MTNMYGITHPSYPNYIAMFSGATQGVTSNTCLTKKPFSTPNLYTVLRKVSYSFAWYSEDLPKMGAVVCSNNDYYQKHNPTTAFNNVADNANRPLTMFNWSDTSATNMKKLETVVCITPNNKHSMHDQNITKQADQWLKSNFSNLIEWCKRHNSIFVIDYDEGKSSSNQIAVMLLGAHVKSNYKLSTKYNHYSFTKYVAHTYNADSTYNSNLKNAKGVTGCFF
jgi:acid phosphatase